MPLLSSTQTHTANGVPLYVPLDGEGIVPGNLQVEGSINSGSGFQGGQITFPGGDVLIQTADGSLPPGTLQLNSVTNGAGLVSNVPVHAPAIFGLSATSPVNPAVFGAPGAAQWVLGAQVSMVISGYRITWGTFGTGDNGNATVPFNTPFNAGGIPVVLCSLMTSGSQGGGIKGYINIGQSDSGSLQSPTATAFQCIAVQSNGAPINGSCCFLAFGPA